MTVSAFSARKASQLIRSSSSSTALNAGAVWTDGSDMNEDNQNNNSYLMSRASACANDETCGLDEAQTYLDDVLLIQKDCLDITMENTNNAICENVDAVAEVVSSLREKIRLQKERLVPLKATMDFVNVVAGYYIVFALLHDLAHVPNIPLDAPLFSPFDAYSAGEINSRGVTTILPQEWFWALRDGYWPSLFSEWFHHGGLVVDVNQFDEKAVCFSPQEWVWSIQNGSFGQLLRENFRYDGYRVDVAFDNEGMTPMTAQDLAWSIQGGYLGDALEHFYRNGGV